MPFFQEAGAAILEMSLIFRLGRRGCQLRAAAFQPVPACFATVRVPMKTLTNGLPRVSGSGILFEADEFCIINLCPSSDSDQDEVLEEELPVQLEPGLEVLHGDGHVAWRLHGRLRSRNPLIVQEESVDWLE